MGIKHTSQTLGPFQETQVKLGRGHPAIRPGALGSRPSGSEWRRRGVGLAQPHELGPPRSRSAYPWLTQGPSRQMWNIPTSLVDSSTLSEQVPCPLKPCAHQPSKFSPLGLATAGALPTPHFSQKSACTGQGPAPDPGCMATPRSSHCLSVAVPRPDLL